MLRLRPLGLGALLLLSLFACRAEEGAEDLSRGTERTADETSDVGIEWLRTRDGDRPFFEAAA